MRPFFFPCPVSLLSHIFPRSNYSFPQHPPLCLATPPSRFTSRSDVLRPRLPRLPFQISVDSEFRPLPLYRFFSSLLSLSISNDTKSFQSSLLDVHEIVSLRVSFGSSLWFQLAGMRHLPYETITRNARHTQGCISIDPSLSSARVR